jgi:hypothetical protein
MCNLFQEVQGKEQHKLKISENKVLRGIFGPKRGGNKRQEKTA